MKAISIAILPLLWAAFALCDARAHAARAGESPQQFWLHQSGARAPTVIQAVRDAGAQIVRASWYGGGERLNRRTSTGETFRPSGLTAAHRTLPFGTRVEVVNMATGARTVVRINDRGPAQWTGRDLDLSRGAARMIGMIGTGTAVVAIRVIE
jgi:rare lipoprotein A